LLAGGALAMVVMAFLLVAFGWSLRSAVRGLVWGVALVTSIYWFSNLWGVSGLSANARWDLWNPATRTGQTDLFMDTLADFSLWTTGHSEGLPVVSTVDTPALRWELRNMPAAFVSSLLPGDNPPAIITYAGEAEPALEAVYSGQDFTLEMTAAWEEIRPGGLPSSLRWLVFRQAPALDQKIVLWLRTDLFPGAEESSGSLPE
jgi:hypothetical protein